MNPLPDGTDKCPHCGYQEGTPYSLTYLQPGTVLKERYLIGKVIEKNNEGATYISYDQTEDKKVLIREFMPEQIAERNESNQYIRPKTGYERQFKTALSDFVELSRQLLALDKITSMFCYVGISIPTFWFGIMLIYLFSVHLHILPSIGMHSDGNRSLGDLILHMVMPCAVLTFANASQYIRYLRSSTITEMSSDYVMVQKAYGMKESGILFRHVLKNAMLPMITVLGMSLQSLVSGAIITEQVFAWPGIGQLAVTAVMQYDYPLIMGITMFTALLVVLGNLLADILYAVFDPRIRKAGC